MKACRFCGEDILASAIKCKHCGSMLDGSEMKQRVAVVEKDPFAEYHTDIKGKKEGKLTAIGVFGIILGILIMCISIAGCLTSNNPEVGEGIITMFMVGLFFTIASYLWARRKKS